MHHMNESDQSHYIVSKIQVGYSNHGLVLNFFFQMFKIIKKMIQLIMYNHLGVLAL